nr:hypothetical protein [Tanacetum cinerariifolium]
RLHQPPVPVEGRRRARRAQHFQHFAVAPEQATNVAAGCLAHLLVVAPHVGGVELRRGAAVEDNHRRTPIECLLYQRRSSRAAGMPFGQRDQDGASSRSQAHSRRWLLKGRLFRATAVPALGAARAAIEQGSVVDGLKIAFKATQAAACQRRRAGGPGPEYAQRLRQGRGHRRGHNRAAGSGMRGALSLAMGLGVAGNGKLVDEQGLEVAGIV